MIPEEAIEVAGKAILANLTQSAPHLHPKWEDCEEWMREGYRQIAKQALEAAAPHMLATAWEDGYGRGYSDHVWSKGHEPRDRNPYRPTNAH